MFDFLDTDWFNIGLEIVFLVLIFFDARRYMKTKEKKELMNIALTIGFAIWVLYPYYKSYFGWQDSQKLALISTCRDTNDTKLCKCVDEAIFKNYVYEEYLHVDRNSSDYKEFLTDAKEECLDESWF